MPLTSLQLQNFTAFAELDLAFSPGVNILVGANGTGKTHVMKVCYAACEASKPGAPLFHQKLMNVFLPSGRRAWRLINGPARREWMREGAPASPKVSVNVFGDNFSIRTVIPIRGFRGERLPTNGAPIESVYIPVKEMLSNAPGFLSLYAEREIHFEEVYNDILLRAYRAFPRAEPDKNRQGMLTAIEESMGGKIRRVDEEFYLSNSIVRSTAMDIEFTLLAEGFRKLGLLWLLIRNGSLREGSVLFWDEPETNLNPTLFGVVVDVLLELQRQGVQVFLATHNYVVLKEFDLRMQKSDNVLFHSFYRTEEGEIACNSTTDYLAIEPNPITEAYDDLYDRQIERSIRGRA